MSIKRSFIIGLMVCFSIVVSLTALPFASASAASIKTKNKEAHKVYERKVRSLKDKYGSTYFVKRYADIVGDKVDELIVSHPIHLGYTSGSYLSIYHYSGGKLKCLLRFAGYAEKVTAFKKAKRIILYTCSHGSEIKDYFKLKKNSYKKIASKDRVSTKAGGISTKSWKYYGKSKKIKKSKFKKLIKGFKGKKKTIKMY